MGIGRDFIGKVLIGILEVAMGYADGIPAALTFLTGMMTGG